MAGFCWEQFEARAIAHPHRPALIEGDTTVSFDELHQRSRAAAHGLASAPGEPVVISAPNSVHFAVAVLATWARGSIPCLLNADAPEQHVEHAVDLTGAHHVIREPLTEGAPAPLPADGSVPDPALPASVVFTSGSTGRPKGVMQSGGNLADGAARVQRSLQLSEDDRILCPIPFTFDYGWGQLLFCLQRGLTLVLPVPANAFGVCDALATHRPTVLAAVPAQAADLLSGLSPIRDTDTSSVELITTTGSKMPPRVAADLLAAFPRARLSLNYGMTETFRSTTLDPGLASVHPHAAGRPIEGVEIEVRRDDGTRAAPGEHGEIIHRGAGTFLGYWGDPEGTLAVRPDQSTVRTGDIGYLDDQHLLHVVGRRDGQLKSMGVRISRDEIETMLLDSGLLHEAAVIGRAHDQVGDLVVAVVALRPEEPAADALKDVKRHANRVMSPYMRPRDYVLVDALPRNHNGKVDYPELVAKHG